MNVVELQSFATAMSGMQENRQLRLESDKEMYARRLQLQRVEAEQKAAEANKRCALVNTQAWCWLPYPKQLIPAVAVAVLAVCPGLCREKPCQGSCPATKLTGQPCCKMLFTVALTLWL